jgi:hypothetical protein
MPVETRLSFSRFEFKYVLPAALRAEVEAELGHFTELDPFVAQQEGNRYLVRSLYFDTPTFDCFHDKIDGVRTRWKFRLRTYSADPDSATPVFLEIKGRHDNLVFKNRVRVEVGSGRELPAGKQLSQAILDHTAAGRVRDQFEFELYRRRLRPYVVVDYLRRPYVSRFDPGFRLTFDERLRGTSSGGLYPTPAEVAHDVAPGCTVMEVKFWHHVPSWFHRIIQAYELRRRSFSKVCEASSRLGVVVDLS